MRTKNLILSIILVALTATASGQFSAIRDRLFQNTSEKVEFLTTEFRYESGQVKELMKDLLSLKNNITANDEYPEPTIIESYSYNHVTISYTEHAGVENWMTEPFETGEEVALESWMAEPFESPEVPVLENWMTAPFNYSEGIEIESWMTSSWI